MTSCEQGAFDVTTGLAGRLGPAVVAAHSAMLNIVGLTFISCPFAVGIAASIR
jgi:MATE family multidrug resistance protein